MEELGGKIECPVCLWDWELESDDDRPTLCHKCGYDSEIKDFDEEALHQWEEENDYPFSDYTEHSILGENHKMTMKDFNQVGDVLRNPTKAKQIHQLLVNMFPNQKPLLDYNYKNDSYAEFKKIIHGIDKYKIEGPTQTTEYTLPKEIETERERKYQAYIKGEVDKYFREDKTDPRKVDVSKFPPILINIDGTVIDGNHRAFIAKKQNKPLKAYKIVSSKNTHPNVKKILQIIDRDLNENKLPFQEQKGSNYILRTFSEDTNESELVWHRDKEDRVVKAEGKTNWMIQLDNKLPKPLTETTYIPKEMYHRVIKGDGELKVRIHKLK